MVCQSLCRGIHPRRGAWGEPGRGGAVRCRTAMSGPPTYPCCPLFLSGALRITPAWRSTTKTRRRRSAMGRGPPTVMPGWVLHTHANGLINSSWRTENKLWVPHSHILFAGRNVTGVFYCYARGPACGLWFGLKKGQTNSNYGLFSCRALSSVSSLICRCSYSTFFSPCKCNQTKPLTEPFPQALLPKSTSLILLTLYLTHPHHLHRLQVLRQQHCHTTGTVTSDVVPYQL